MGKEAKTQIEVDVNWMLNELKSLIGPEIRMKGVGKFRQFISILNTKNKPDVIRWICQNRVK